MVQSKQRKEQYPNMYKEWVEQANGTSVNIRSHVQTSPTQRSITGWFLPNVSYVRNCIPLWGSGYETNCICIYGLCNAGFRASFVWLLMYWLLFFSSGILWLRDSLFFCFGTHIYHPGAPTPHPSIYVNISQLPTAIFHTLRHAGPFLITRVRFTNFPGAWGPTSSTTLHTPPPQG